MVPASDRRVCAGHRRRSSAVTVPSSPARRLRRYAAGTALVAFPLVLIAQEFTNPLTEGDGQDFLAVAAGESGVPS